MQPGGQRRPLADRPREPGQAEKDRLEDILGVVGVVHQPMGGPQDSWAVVDSRGAVKGIDGLRVIDASIMPVVPSVAINPTTIMIAERIAEAVYATEPGRSHRGVHVAPTA